MTDGIGTVLPAEWATDPASDPQRPVQRLTCGCFHNYPLYYFGPSVTADNRYLVFHSERTGWVQLHRLDLMTGQIVQLTEARTRDSGWAFFCEQRLRGVYNHLSALNTAKAEVYYFQDDELRCTHVGSLANRIVAHLPGRVPVGQSAFSLDGRWYAFIHANAKQFTAAVADAVAMINMGRHHDHEAWRQHVPSTISLIDVETGRCRNVIELDYFVHHVLFVGDDRLLINHPKGDMGMWIINVDGSGYRHLRPRDENGAVCHAVVTQRGIFYDAYHSDHGAHRCRLGRYDLVADRFEEVDVPGIGFTHIGNDPAGRWLFCDSRAQTDGIFSIEVHRDGPEPRAGLRRLMRLNKPPANGVGGQRVHAHPILGPDRRTLYFTECIDGFAQVCSMNVQDLVAAADDRPAL